MSIKGSRILLGRTTSVKPCIAEYPDIEVLSAMSGPWEPEEAAASVEQLLLTNDDVDAIYLDSDWLGSGITTYLESAGYGKVGEDNHIFYVGVGGMPQALDYIREGWMDITINTPSPTSQLRQLKSPICWSWARNFPPNGCRKALPGRPPSSTPLRFTALRPSARKASIPDRC